MKYRRGIFIVVYRKEKDKNIYLVLKRKLHWVGWEFVKGGIEDESETEAARRELKEETGITSGILRKHNLSGKYKYDKEYEDRRGFLGQSWKLYSCEVNTSKIKIDKREHSKYKWLEFKKAEKLLTWENQKKCLKIVENKII